VCSNSRDPDVVTPFSTCEINFNRPLKAALRRMNMHKSEGLTLKKVGPCLNASVLIGSLIRGIPYVWKTILTSRATWAHSQFL
jgi:hypothetical protein